MSDGGFPSSGHHAPDCPARLGLVKGLRVVRLAPTALRAADALDETLGRARSWHLRDGPVGLWPVRHRARFEGRKGHHHECNVDHTQHRATIGRHIRLYHAYITTAPAALDAPSTLALRTAPVADLLGLALDEIALNMYRAMTEARLILVDTTERSHQKRRCREHRHLCEPGRSCSRGSEQAAALAMATARGAAGRRPQTGRTRLTIRSPWSEPISRSRRHDDHG